MRITGGLIVALAVTASGAAFAAPPAAAHAPARDGAALYVQYCQPCHGADRHGYAADNAPSLVSPTFLETADDRFLRAAIERGRAGTAMGGYGTRYGGPLAPAEVDTLIAYLRGPTTPLPPSTEPAPGNRDDGERLYRTHCETCHGSSTQRGDAVHLANAMFLDTASNAFLRTAIVRGRPGTRMAAWGPQLTAREIDDVVAYLRSLSRPVQAPVAGRALIPIDQGPIVINPEGAAATLTLRDDLYVSVADLAKAYDEKRRLVIIDARTPSDYLRMHIAGAISIPYFDMRDLDKVPNDGTWIVAYCACPHHISGIVVDELRERGYRHTAVLDEGIFAWQLQGHPTVVASGQLPIPAPPPTPASATVPR